MLTAFLTGQFAAMDWPDGDTVTGSLDVVGDLTVGGTADIVDVLTVEAGIAGTATNDSAAAGIVGQIITNSAAADSIGSWSTNSAQNITSVSLTAGDWDVEGAVAWKDATIGTYYVTAITTTSANVGLDPVAFGRVDTPFITTANSYFVQNSGLVRMSLASTTTVYLVGQLGFTGGTPTAGGRLRARRVR